jgi:hypothetical protein
LYRAPRRVISVTWLARWRGGQHALGAAYSALPFSASLTPNAVILGPAGNLLFHARRRSARIEFDPACNATNDKNPERAERTE